MGKGWKDMSLKKLGTIIIAAAGLLVAALFLGIQLNQEYEKQIEIGTEKEGQTEKTSTATKDQMPVLDQESGKVYVPLRFIMSELGGILEWKIADHATVIKFQNKVMRVEPRNSNATLNGYGIVLKDVPKTINDTLYVSTDFVEQYFGIQVNWKKGSTEMTLRTVGGKVPVIAANVLEHTQKEATYEVEIPIIVGLNDANYEKNLNYMISTELVKQVQDFVSDAKREENSTENPATLVSDINVSYCSPQWISLSIEGKMNLGGMEKQLKRSLNLDLTTQKIVPLAAIFKKDTYEKKLSNWMGEEGWAEEAQNRYYIQGKAEGKEKQLVIYSFEKEKNTFEEVGIPFDKIKKYLVSNYQGL